MLWGQGRPKAWVPLGTLKTTPLHPQQNHFFSWNSSPHCKAHSQPLGGPSFLIVLRPYLHTYKHTKLTYQANILTGFQSSKLGARAQLRCML